MSKMIRDIIIAVIIPLSAIMIAAFLNVSQAPAHGWYPIACCSGYDCAPVIKAIASGDGTLIVTTKHGTAMVPSDMTRRESQDHQMHACIRPDQAGIPRVVCIFMPPGI